MAQKTRWILRNHARAPNRQRPITQRIRTRRL